MEQLTMVYMKLSDRSTGNSLLWISACLCLLWLTPGTTICRQGSGRPAQIICFQSNTFPTVDAPRIDPATLKDALKGYDVAYPENTESLNRELNGAGSSLLILAYGSAFPVGSWQSIRSFISRGGGLILLGGSPFHQPVMENSGRWVMGTLQPTYAHELLIGPADEIDIRSDPYYYSGARLKIAEGVEISPSKFQMPSKVYELTVRFTSGNDFANEIGSAGPRDAVMRPLVQVLNGDELPVACPLLEIDRLRGDGAGGRWIIEPSDLTVDVSLIRFCVQRALQGAVEIEANPFFACVADGELPAIRINLSRPAPTEEDTDSIQARVTVTNSAGERVFNTSFVLVGTKQFQSAAVKISADRPLPPGFYRADVECAAVPWRPNSVSAGFWIRDEKLLRSGPELSTSRDWLLRNGKTFPAIGTSYMGAHQGRKFLIEPDPLSWEQDFARMEKLGVNFVRAGLWTGWQKIMLDPGNIDESFLRSLDALVLTAAKHNIILCFNLFAFQPPLNGGTNPYLDPRALEWQKSFVTLIASRYRNVGWINYDLINEPSYSPADKIWQNLPIGDEFERAAWKEWVARNCGPDRDSITDNWRGGNIDSLPSEDDISYSQIRENKHPRKALDFVRFTQDVLTNWADEIRGVIRRSGGNSLVTLGQDEGGTGLRSEQQFHYTAVDYTSMHTWWLNDELLWDGVMTKVPEKPNLISETGLMRLENIDGEPWRSPGAAEKLLGRKFAYAFQSRGAGAVEWCWNINEYQSTDNEVGIGMTRADGTLKKESQVIKDFSDFFRAAAPYLSDYQPDRVILVIPASKLFSGRPNALAGTQRIITTLARNFGIVPTALSEYKLTDVRLRGAKLVIVPDPEMLYDSAASALFEASRNRSIILFTGSIEGNQYGKLTPQIMRLGLQLTSTPVSHYEGTNWGSGSENGRRFVTFGQEESEYLRKADCSPLDSLTGTILQEPLPIECASEDEPLTDMLTAVLNYSGISTHVFNSPVAARVLMSASSALVVCVNESSVEFTQPVLVDGHEFGIPVGPGGTRLVLIERKSGKIIEATSGEAISKVK